MNEINVRHATPADASQIAAIHCASWRDAYASVLDDAFLGGPIEEDRSALWSDRLQNPDKARIILLADVAQAAPAAFVCAYRDLDPVWGSWIDNLHVLPALRGKGIGEHLMRSAARALAAEARTTGLHVWTFEANQAALRFYRRLGGEVVERGTSQIPAAKGATILRMFWPTLSALADGS
jgi:ribosomal protein S18 acetylase RimI-like enzyme